MRWRFRDETIEELGSGVLHQPECAQLDPHVRIGTHLAGSSVVRDGAPRECFACQPIVVPLLGDRR